MKTSALKIKTKTIYIYILPFFILFVVAFIIPLFMALGISFTDWKGGKTIDFVGFKNYIKLVTDKTFWLSFVNNLKFIAVMLVAQIGLAFIFAIFIQNKRVRFQGLHRTLIFLPSVLSAIVVAMIWQIVYNNDFGMIAAFMKGMGLGDKIPLWLDNPSLVIWSLCIVLIWQYVGQYVIIIMAGLQNVDTSLFEAAKIDGATSFQVTRYVTLPLIKPTLIVCVTLCIAGSMKLFDTIYALTGGGPGRTSMVTALYAYDVAFKTKRLGYAASVSIGMIILSVLLIVLAQKLMHRKEEI